MKRKRIVALKDYPWYITVSDLARYEKGKVYDVADDSANMMIAAKYAELEDDAIKRLIEDERRAKIEKAADLAKPYSVSVKTMEMTEKDVELNPKPNFITLPHDGSESKSVLLAKKEKKASIKKSKKS